MSKVISKTTLEDWAYIFGARFEGGKGSTYKIVGKLENGVDFALSFTKLIVTKQGTFYCQNNSDWNAAKVSEYALENFSFTGKGSRSQETWNLAKDMFSLLV